MSFLQSKNCLRILLCILTICIVASTRLTARATELNNADLLGTWKLTKLLDSSEISSIDDDEAAALVGQFLVITLHQVTLAGEACRKPPKFTRHYEDTAKYVRETAHAPVGRLGLPTTVEAVELACTEALIKGHNKMVVYWKGYFFDAAKQD
ncbi:hypothetical protein [Massilia sp. TWR1-2-2]|uniref:hypothetical protein n=1 Tax=Massilia sp. TWR1-2-2 TaxID=2804584 RepID=UPI003CFB3C80